MGKRIRTQVCTVAMAAGLILAVAHSAHAQGLSLSSSSNAGSTCGGANNADGFCGSSTSLPINNATQLQSRYAWNINADVGAGSTRDTSGNAQHNIAFTATAPGSYQLAVATSRVGDINRQSDVVNCSGSADTSGVTGSSNLGPVSGSLSLGDPGGFGSGGGNLTQNINQSANATIGPRLSNGAGQGHTLTFTWNGAVRSNSCEAAVRIGQQNGSTTGCGACQYAGTPARTQSSDGHFVTVTFTHFCGDGVINGTGEQCDAGAGNGAATSCCNTNCTFRTAGAVCRASAGICDVQETCPANPGTAGACPANAFQSSATVCRGSAGICDVVENCTGSSAACPADGFQSSATVCRGSAGICDVVENCTGSAAACPPDGFQSSATVCRGSAGICDVGENCTGSGAACPADGFESSSTVCRGSAGICDVVENCTGSGPACPADGFESSSTVCRAGSGDLCDPTENCTGSGVACPADVVAPNTTVCNPGSGDSCDPDESCTGVAGQACPTDTVTPSGTVCRPGSSDLCDPDETCTGVADDPCPADSVSGAFVTCRASAGPCDIAENCTGVATQPCPADAVEPATTTCRPAAGVCDVADNCDGSGTACPADVKSTAECRAVADVCDVAESCDGVNDNCPADAFEPATTVCRPAAGVCDAVENCTGTGAACPTDSALPDADSDTVCDLIDNCDTIANPGQENDDTDPLGNACDPCTNSVPTGQNKVKLTLTRLLAPANDDKLSFKGFFTDVPSTPTIDPVMNGMRIIISDSAGNQPVDITIPGGAYNTGTKAGWKVNGSNTVWLYKNPGTVIPLVNGITKMQLKKQSSPAGTYKFTVKGKNGNYPVNPVNVPLIGALMIDVPFAMTGQCGEATFTAVPPARPSCVSTSGGKNIKCK